MANMKPIGPNPYLPVADKAGEITHLYYAQNAGHEFVTLYQGKGVLNPKGLAHGFTALKDLYAADPNPTVREKGLAYYRQWDLSCRNKTAKMEACPGSVAGTTKQRPVAFPDKWLPQEVLARRAGTSAVSVAGWEPPALEEPETFEEAKPKPRESKRTKSGG